MEFPGRREYERVSEDIKNSIDRSCSIAISKGTTQEPDFVSCLFRYFPEDLRNSLAAYCPGYWFNISSVFCHQKPLANFHSCNKKHPEIGDILFVYFENDGGTKRCNALLLQAKKIKSYPYQISVTEEHQLELYQGWPEFTYERAGSLNGKIRSVLPKSPTAGAQYLLMQEPCNSEDLLNCAGVKNKIVAPSSRLSDSILGLLNFSTGRSFSERHNSGTRIPAVRLARRELCRSIPAVVLLRLRWSVLP